MPETEKKETPEITEAEAQGRSILFSSIKTITSIPLIIELIMTLLPLLMKYFKKDDKTPKPKYFVCFFMIHVNIG